MAFDDLLKQLEKSLAEELQSPKNQLSSLLGKDVSDLTNEQKRALYEHQIQQKEEEIREYERKKQATPPPQKEGLFKMFIRSLNPLDFGDGGPAFAEVMEEERHKELRKEVRLLKEALVVVNAASNNKTPPPPPPDTRSAIQKKLDRIRALEQERDEELKKATTDDDRNRTLRFYRQEIDKAMESQ